MAIIAAEIWMPDRRVLMHALLQLRHWYKWKKWNVHVGLNISTQVL